MKTMKQFPKELEQKVIEFYLAPNTLQDTAWYILGHKCTKAVTKILNKYNIQKHSEEVIKRLWEEKNLAKYGVKNPSASQAVKDKRKNTLLQKYGVENIFQDKTVKDNIKQANIEKYGVPYYNQTAESKKKHKQTCLDKYGVEFVLQAEEVRQKGIQTCLDKYGVQNYVETDEFRSRAAAKQKETIAKQINTKRKNHTFTCSTDEKIYYKILQAKFGAANVLKQYKDTRYPFLCDFYIKDKDLFIELNFIWTHGGKLYTGSAEDIIKLNVWQEKAKSSNYYKNAIETWTIRDVQKYTIAKENNLNYLVFYSKKETDNWLNKQGD